MKRMKKIAYGGLLFGASLMLLGGCGSNHQSKETTASSIQTESSSKESNSSDNVENHHLTLAEPFKKNIPQYVCDGDDQNRRVQAIIIPYGDTKDEVKVTEYDDGRVEKSYIVPYKIKKVTDGDKCHLPIYQYSFYDESDHDWRNFNATWGTFEDLPNQHFITLMDLSRTNEPSKAKDKSEKELRDDFSSGECVVLYDNPDAVSMK